MEGREESGARFCLKSAFTVLPKYSNCFKINRRSMQSTMHRVSMFKVTGAAETRTHILYHIIGVTTKTALFLLPSCTDTQ